MCYFQKFHSIVYSADCDFQVIKQFADGVLKDVDKILQEAQACGKLNVPNTLCALDMHEQSKEIQLWSYLRCGATPIPESYINQQMMPRECIVHRHYDI